MSLLALMATFLIDGLADAPRTMTCELAAETQDFGHRIEVVDRGVVPVMLRHRIEIKVGDETIRALAFPQTATEVRDVVIHGRAEDETRYLLGVRDTGRMVLRRLSPADAESQEEEVAVGHCDNVTQHLDRWLRS